MIFAVTGSNGFLGVHIIHHLLKMGHEVRAIHRPKSVFDEFELVKSYHALPSSTYDQLDWCECELYDVTGLQEIFQDCDYVIHLAGLISYSKRDREKMIRVNQGYTANVVNAAIDSDVKKLLYSSSIAALTKNDKNEIINEDNLWSSEQPHSFYGFSKYLGECEILRGKEEGLSVVMVNPGIVLGYGDWEKGSNQLFKNAFKQFYFFSRGVTGFIGVRDVAKVMEKLCLSNANGERFILVSENKTFESIAKTMAVKFKKRKPFIEVKGFIYQTIYFIISLMEFLGINGMLSRETVKASISKNQFSNQKVKDFLNFEFESMDSCLERVCEEYKKSPSS
ncbi:MAG: NAD-dependent epimerase/dehydratase family protein [Bacteroidia bacterium]|nr:NAD-dependent epimerase/dehydratase family protein [Bacteroidia bacterium]